MNQQSTKLDVPWFKIMHAGFNVGFSWTITSVVLGILAFLMANGIEASIQVIFGVRLQWSQWDSCSPS
ncbi:MAG: hypothetical protein CMJ79_12580 [Planctomycetaceae bacterium]|nr:hypothetical protein [Planctomycetaceae bacterium]